MRPRRAQTLVLMISLAGLSCVTGRFPIRDFERDWERTPCPRTVREPEAPDSMPTFLACHVDVPATLEDSSRLPRYPDILRDARRVGMVRTQFVVDERGRVLMQTFRAFESSDTLFAKSVRSGLVNLRYRAADRHGVRVRQVVSQTFVFRLREKAEPACAVETLQPSQILICAEYFPAPRTVHDATPSHRLTAVGDRWPAGVAGWRPRFIVPDGPAWPPTRIY